MQKFIQTPAATSIVCFHALVLLGAGWFASYLPDSVSGRALIAIIAGPIVFFWVMFWLDRTLPVKRAVENGTSFAAAGSLLIFLSILKAVGAGAAAVVSIGLIGSHTYNAGQASLVYATAVIFYTFLTYTFSMVIVTSLELLAHKLQKRVPTVSAYQSDDDVQVHAMERPKFLFAQSNIFVAERAGMIVATCLMAVFMVAYLSAILF